MKKRYLVAVLTAIIILFVSLVFIFSQSSRKKVPSRIILVTLDTLRADHLGCYGYPRSTSPFIDQLAEKSVVFKKSIAQIPLTVPSHASLFTARYPDQIKILNNSHRLDSSYLTLAEFMRERGYRTAAFVSTCRQFSGTNLDQGFELFDEPSSYKEPLIYRPAAETIDRVMKWINDRPASERFFIWIHLFDAHHPYYPPRKYYDMFAENPDEEILALVEPRDIDLSLIERLRPYEIGIQALVDNYCYGEKGEPSEALVKLINAYDGEIRYLDEELRRLYNRFAEVGLNENSLWIITSDHGEGLGQHGWMDHGVKIYNEAIHVPLIFHFPSGENSPWIENKPVELVDIFPTIAGLLGVDLPTEAGKGRGRSLVAELSREEGTFTRDRMEEKLAFSRRTPLDDPDELGETWEPGDLYCLQDGNFKYFYRTEGEPEFYDLRTDPHETNNLVGKGGECESALRAAILDRINEVTPTGEDFGPVLVDWKTKESLRALGYLH